MESPPGRAQASRLAPAPPGRRDAVRFGSRTHIGRFVSYALFSYLEKALIFLFPLVALYTTGDKTTFNKIEFIFAVAAVSSLFLDGGLRIHLLYAYHQSGQALPTATKILAAFRTLLKCYLGIGILLSITAAIWAHDRLADWLSIEVRALFLATIAFYAVWCRVIDRPAQVFAYSVPVYIVGAGLLWMMSDWGTFDVAVALGIPHLLAVFLLVYPRGSATRSTLIELVQHVRAAIAYGWPVLLSIAVSMGVANAGKIYAYQSLSSDEMFDIAFAQRMALIVQLAHVSFTGYLAKTLFMSDDRNVHTKSFITYFLFLAGAIGFALFAASVMPYLGIAATAPANPTFVVILLYMLLWCFGSYFELYINRHGRNGLILIGTLLSAAVFLGLVFLSDLPILFRIAGAMATSAGIYTLFICICLLRLRN